MLGMSYDSDNGRDFAAQVMAQIRNAAYEASIKLADEKGPFPLFSKVEYLQSPFVQRLPDGLKEGIAANGVRNSHLLAIAPTGTISLLAGNVSSGIEPIYALEATRAVRGHDLKMHNLDIRDFAYDQWLRQSGRKRCIPDVFITAKNLSAKAHLKMQACLQPFVDNAISKTVNLPPEATTDDVSDIYSLAYSSGLKGCTVFRPGARPDQVIRAPDEAHCCHVDREPD
jgi:ribonucleoside-diphosphate reductase alpha chain